MSRLDCSSAKKACEDPRQSFLLENPRNVVLAVVHLVVLSEYVWPKCTTIIHEARPSSLPHVDSVQRGLHKKQLKKLHEGYTSCRLQAACCLNCCCASVEFQIHFGKRWGLDEIVNLINNLIECLGISTLVLTSPLTFPSRPVPRAIMTERLFRLQLELRQQMIRQVPSAASYGVYNFIRITGLLRVHSFEIRTRCRSLPNRRCGVCAVRKGYGRCSGNL